MMELLLRLQGFVGEALSDLTFESRGEVLPTPNVWVGDLPGKKERPGHEDFPFVLVELLDADDDLDSGRDTLQSVRLLVGTCAGAVPNDSDVAPAYHDLVNALSRLRRRLLETRRLDGVWELVDRVRIELYQEQAFPYYFGSLVCRWRSRRPTRELSVSEEVEVYGSAYGEKDEAWRIPNDAPDGVENERWQ